MCVLGTASDCVAFAQEYFEVELDLALVAQVLSGGPVTQTLALTLNPEADWEALGPELRSMDVQTS